MAVLPVFNVLAIPDANLYQKSADYKKTTGRMPVAEDKVILIVQKENTEREDLTSDSFYPIGVTGVITEVNDKDGYYVIRTKNRVNLDEVIVYRDHSIDLSISKRPDIDDIDLDYVDQRLKAIKQEVLKFASQYQWGGWLRGYVAGWTSLSEVAAAISPWMMNGNAERYAVLAEDSLTRRNEMLEQMIYENLEMTRINTEAKTAQEEDYQKIYRESAIRKQIEYLQKELDEMHPEQVSDVRRFEIKIEESGMNETARKEADKVLNRLKQEGNHSQEAGMLYDYLDFLTSLSWKKEKARDISLEEAEKVLEEDHFGLKKVKKRIIEQIAVMNLKRQQSGSILLFVGAPGTGKTSIGQSIAKALQRKYVRVSLGGVRDEADIRGHRRTYIGAMPGRIMDGIQKSGVSNPVMVLDEVDKLGVSYNGDPASALLEVLDPEQNSTFTDHYMNVPYDLSGVMFICTANSLDTIPQPLLDRMEVIQFQGYTPLEKFQIARRHLIPKALKAVGIREENFQITDQALETIISDYTRESGVRGLKKRIDVLCRSAAVELVKAEDQAGAGNPVTGNVSDQAGNDDQIADNAEKTGSADQTADNAEKTDSADQTANNAKKTGRGPVIAVNNENLRDFMDMRPMRHGLVKETDRPGIVTGLAWTPVGGEILYIETMLTRGSGKILITGQLGDVMRESAHIAVSLVKSIYPHRADVFEKNDLHIHVPDGSTPKDGPSAGITLTTALASLVNDSPVSAEIAMTGEVSLRGDINPIGGLPEKLMAAQRAGVKTVFIPTDNEEDLRDVAQEVKDQLTIIPVSTVEEVLQQAGIKEAPAVQAV
ncbi:MAG: endopeptidase La [Lachnospiraceae bacterium]